jgi:hypothetical protein
LRTEKLEHEIEIHFSTAVFVYFISTAFDGKVGLERAWKDAGEVYNTAIRYQD